MTQEPTNEPTAYQLEWAKKKAVEDWDLNTGYAWCPEDYDATWKDTGSWRFPTFRLYVDLLARTLAPKEDPVVLKAREIVRKHWGHVANRRDDDLVMLAVIEALRIDPKSLT